MLTADFAIMLHKNMFGDVWKWAGIYRATARNIGIEAHRIPVEVTQLLDDRGYRELMDHWHEVMLGRILDVRYKDVVGGLEGQARLP